MLSALWAWFIGFFSKEKIGILFTLLFKAGTSAVAAEIANLDLQRKALEFVRELARDNTLTNAQKAKVFNEKLLEYGKKLGKTLGESVINCLRELAVNALKAECGK